MDSLTNLEFYSKQWLLIQSVCLFGIGSVIFIYCEQNVKNMNAVNGIFIILGLTAGISFVALGLWSLLAAINVIL